MSLPPAQVASLSAHPLAADLGRPAGECERERQRQINKAVAQLAARDSFGGALVWLRPPLPLPIYALRCLTLAALPWAARLRLWPVREADRLAVGWASKLTV